MMSSAVVKMSNEAVAGIIKQAQHRTGLVRYNVPCNFGQVCDPIPGHSDIVKCVHGKSQSSGASARTTPIEKITTSGYTF